MIIAYEGEQIRRKEPYLEDEWWKEKSCADIAVLLEDWEVGDFSVHVRLSTGAVVCVDADKISRADINIIKEEAT